MFLRRTKPKVLYALLLLFSITACKQPQIHQEIVFQSGSFRLVGDLSLPQGKGPHPVVIFVHGDGPNDRTSGGTYLPIMDRMLRAGYATFAWDKPGTGESSGQIDRNRLVDQRSQIVLDALATLKKRPDIDPQRIGLWGVSQAGYVMPAVLSKSEEIAFMIAVSCPGVAGVDQGAYLVAQQARCSGLSPQDAEQVEALLSTIERVQTYEEYVQLKEQIDAYPLNDVAKQFGFTLGVKPRAEWHAGNLKGDYFWEPMQIIERTKIPVLALFGAKDTQVDPIQGAHAYRQALERAGNPNFHVELIQNADHTLILSKTGCLDEILNRSARERRNYAPEYLDRIEAWLLDLHR